MKVFLVVLSVAVASVAIGTAAVLGYGYLALSSFPESCYDVTRQHPDAALLQREVEALPGVGRATVDYRRYDFRGGKECAAERDGSRTSVEMAVTLAAGSPGVELGIEQASAIRTVGGAFAAHPDWRGTLRLEVGTDRLRVSLPLTPDGFADLGTATEVFEKVRALGTTHAGLRFGTGTPVLRVTLTLPPGSTADDLAPAYRTARQLQGSGRVPVVLTRVAAADGSVRTGAATTGRPGPYEPGLPATR